MFNLHEASIFYDAAISEGAQRASFSEVRSVVVRHWRLRGVPAAAAANPQETGV